VGAAAAYIYISYTMCSAIPPLIALCATLSESQNSVHRTTRIACINVSGNFNGEICTKLLQLKMSHPSRDESVVPTWANSYRGRSVLRWF